MSACYGRHSVGAALSWLEAQNSELFRSSTALGDGPL